MSSTNIYYLITFCSVLLYTIFYIKGALPKTYKHFLLYVYLMLSLDFYANYLYENKETNLHIYNLLTLLEFNVLFMFYKKLSRDVAVQKAIKFSILLFNVIYVISILYYVFVVKIKYYVEYNSISASSGSILISIILFLFFKELLVSNKILNYKRDLSFWITFGLLVYYLGSTPVVSLLNFLNDNSTITIDNFESIHFYLAVFMQSCFIFGILWSQKKVK